MATTLVYVHDPMCSWCYAFGPVLEKLLAALPANVGVERLLGGLAPDTDQPMPQAQQEQIEATWRRIEEQVPGTTFNFAFWREQSPRRSTYPSCRAVIAARLQGTENDVAMTRAIQRAYYREARNPSDTDTLVALASELGLDGGRFARDLVSAAVEQQLQAEIAHSRALHADSFPSLVLVTGSSSWPVAIDYNVPAPMLDAIEFLLEEVGQGEA